MMRKWLSTIGLLLASLSVAPFLWAQSDSFEPSPYIFKLTSANCETEPRQRVQTGFQVKGQTGIFTALHGVVGCTTIIAEAGGNGSDYRDLIIGKVDIQNDIAVLWSPQVKIAPQVGLETAKQEVVIDPKATYRVIGYPLDLFRQKPMVDVRILERTELGNLLPDEAIPAIADRDSPAIDAKVFSIQAHLVPGHSGAPLLNQNDEVVAVGNGGLDLGRVEMGWAIPWDAIELKAVSVKVSQIVSWSDVRKLNQLRKSESELFSYSTSEVAATSPTSTPSLTSTETPVVKSSCPFWFQIVDSSLKPIYGAQIKVIYGLESVEDFADSDGEYRGEIACNRQNPLVTVEISAEGFVALEKNIQLTTSRVRIRLLSVLPILTSTPSPIVTPVVIPTTQLPENPTCKVTGVFYTIWYENREKLGCNTSALITSPVTVEPFERGYIVWIKRLDLIYVLSIGKSWSQHTNSWSASENRVSCKDAEQFGYPVMGFGKLWCFNESVKLSLGNPTGGELPHEFAQQQFFEGGFIFEIYGGKKIILFEDGAWSIN